MEPVSINKNRLFFWAVIIAVLNPIFSGLILGLVLFSEPGTRREGRIVTLFSIAWGILVLLLVVRYRATVPGL